MITFEDPDMIGLAADARLQLSALREGFNGVRDYVGFKADAAKAGFDDLDIVELETTFKPQYPENIIRKVKNDYLFAPDFASCKHFEGDIQDSPLADMLDKLDRNHQQFQSSIDARFPSDQPKNSKVNQVFTWILNRGYNQARSFLNSLKPFHTMMTNAGLGVEESWKKCFSYAKAVFTRIYNVRTVSKRLSPGAMLYGMLRATMLLEEYVAVQWIRHPDVSSSLVIASLQREGKLMEEAVKKFEDHLKKLDDTDKLAKKNERGLKDLYQKNPNLNK